MFTAWPFISITDSGSLKSFRPKVRLFIERERFILKTVESSWELEDALKLRFRVFHQELLGKTNPAHLDQDDFDLLGDHLIIIDKTTSKTIGTYRLISSTFSSRFYSAQEFELGDLLRLPGVKLELGRACIDAAHRNGAILALLWKGIHRYFEAVNAQYLFGCSSIQSTDPSIVSRCCQYFRQHGYVSTAMSFPTQLGYRFAPRLDWEHPADSQITRYIPPLLMSYLNAGAIVGAEPALDREFRCVDFMTVLDTTKIASSYVKRFGNS